MPVSAFSRSHKSSLDIYPHPLSLPLKPKEGKKRKEAKLVSTDAAAVMPPRTGGVLP